MKFGVVVFPGSNCDRDMFDALSVELGQEVQWLWHKDHALDGFTTDDCIVLPGGFSYGDYLRCGAIAAHSPILREVKARAEKGMAVIGICNGFQVLTEMGLLPGVLMRNAGLKFVCKSVALTVKTRDSAFTSGWSAGETARFPIAHHDGNFTADAATLERLAAEGA